jgi:hypothetical protein
MTPSTTTRLSSAMLGGSQTQKDNAPLRTTCDPEITVDLGTLHNVNRASSEALMVAEKEPRLSPQEGCNELSTNTDAKKASFIGESWYASYLLSHISSEHANLYQPITQYQRRSAQDNRETSRSGGQLDTRPTINNWASDLPSTTLLNKLVDAYFDRFHVLCPILDKDNFLASLHDRSVSQTLLRSVMFVASIHCNAEICHLMGYSTRLDAGDSLFSKARAAFDSDSTSNRMVMLLSSFFLHYWFGQPTTFRDFLWWLATAIRSAQCMGMHRTTLKSALQQKERKMWRRIWWCLYVSCKPQSSYAPPSKVCFRFVTDKWRYPQEHR